MHVGVRPCQSTAPEGASFLNFAKLRLAGLEWLSIPREFPGIGEGKKKHRAQGKAPSLKKKKKKQFFFIATLIKGPPNSHGSRAGPCVVRGSGIHLRG